MNIEELYTKAGLAFKRGEAASWEAAEAMAALGDAGESQRQIAARLACSQRTVSRYVLLWRESAGLTEKPSFSEAMTALRTDKDERLTLPKAPEQRAELVAALLKDKAVADAPVVREVQERHSDRRIRANAAAFNREHGTPTRGQEDQAIRRLSLVHKVSFWGTTEMHITTATRALAEARREIGRTGLPDRRMGGLLKAGRALVREWQHFEEVATTTGIGAADDTG